MRSAKSSSARTLAQMSNAVSSGWHSWYSLYRKILYLEIGKILTLLFGFIKRASEPHMDEDLRLIAADIVINLWEDVDNSDFFTSAIFLSNDQCSKIRQRIQPLIIGVENPTENFIQAIRKFMNFTRYDFLSDMYLNKHISEIIEINSDFEIDFLDILKNKYLKV